MKNEKNNYAFIANELITIIVVCLILFILVAIMIYQSSNNEKFHIMKYNATNFATSISTFDISGENNGTYYLRQLIDRGVHSEIKSPFNPASMCSDVESFVKNENSKKYVTLKCGAYLIDNQYIGEPTFKIYKVGDWLEEKPDGKDEKGNVKKNVIIEERVKYNYVDNFQNAYDTYYEPDIFLYFLNRDRNTNYATLEDAINNEKVVAKTFYREKELFIREQK